MFDVGQFGTLEGGDHICRQMHDNVDLGFRSTPHFLISPTVSVNPDLVSATCFYYLWETATPRTRDGADVAYRIGGWYDADVVKGGDGIWRFRRPELTLKRLSPNTDGWQVLPESFDDLG